MFGNCIEEVFGDVQSESGVFLQWLQDYLHLSLGPGVFISEDHLPAIFQRNPELHSTHYQPAAHLPGHCPQPSPAQASLKWDLNQDQAKD